MKKRREIKTGVVFGCYLVENRTKIEQICYGQYRIFYKISCLKCGESFEAVKKNMETRVNIPKKCKFCPSKNDFKVHYSKNPCSYRTIVPNLSEDIKQVNCVQCLSRNKGAN